MSETPAKKSWPQLVGTKGKSAKETIQKENSDLNVIVLKDGSATTRDFSGPTVSGFLSMKTGCNCGLRTQGSVLDRVSWQSLETAKLKLSEMIMDAG
ncbi:hypothetical protein V6N11_077454 [Hibiscus sabdariffa]|uniref:Uncharacterized protein n=1 Tax=Hibiscus sabdariffa TaxID=183260 RepID=A0ABR2TDA3_9ROSI